MGSSGGYQLRAPGVLGEAGIISGIIWARLRSLTGSSWVARTETTQVSIGAACSLLSVCTHFLLLDVAAKMNFIEDLHLKVSPRMHACHQSEPR